MQVLSKNEREFKWKKFVFFLLLPFWFLFLSLFFFLSVLFLIPPAISEINEPKRNKPFAPWAFWFLSAAFCWLDLKGLLLPPELDLLLPPELDFVVAAGFFVPLPPELDFVLVLELLLLLPPLEDFVLVLDLVPLLFPVPVFVAAWFRLPAGLPVERVVANRMSTERKSEIILTCFWFWCGSSCSRGSNRRW